MTFRVSSIQLASMVAHLFPLPFRVQASSIAMHGGILPGNRLLYREEATTVIQNPGTQSWWISQNDQPLDIARKLLPYTFSIPSLSSNGLAIGNSSQGMFTTTLAGTLFQLIVQEMLPGHPLPASLERVLWQPAHQNPGILYAIATEPSAKVPSFLCKGGRGVGSGTLAVALWVPMPLLCQSNLFYVILKSNPELSLSVAAHSLPGHQMAILYSIVQVFNIQSLT